MRAPMLEGFVFTSHGSQSRGPLIGEESDLTAGAFIEKLGSQRHPVFMGKLKGRNVIHSYGHIDPLVRRSRVKAPDQVMGDILETKFRAHHRVTPFEITG